MVSELFKKKQKRSCPPSVGMDSWKDFTEIAGAELGGIQAGLQSNRDCSVWAPRVDLGPNLDLGQESSG